MTYRLKIKCRGRWILGKVEYFSLLEAQERQLELELKGIESKLCDNTGMEVKI